METITVNSHKAYAEETRRLYGEFYKSCSSGSECRSCVSLYDVFLNNKFGGIEDIIVLWIPFQEDDVY